MLTVLFHAGPVLTVCVCVAYWFLRRVMLTGRLQALASPLFAIIAETGLVLIIVLLCRSKVRAAFIGTLLMRRAMRIAMGVQGLRVTVLR